MTAAVLFANVSKRYHRHRQTSLREALSNVARWRHNSGQREWLWAVRDLSFEIEPGRAVGIIGPNGAGKSTVLKLLGRVTRPTEGSIAARGRVSSLIELGAGFHPELTGRENVYLNGAILGIPRRELQRRYDDIVEFVGLESFMDTPVKYYSSGMYARLGFGVAAHSNPDVLLVDEVLAVGDYSFQHRCYERMHELKRGGTALVFVSHDLAAVTGMCDETIVLDHGHEVFHGTPPEAVAEYAELIRRPIASKAGIEVGRDAVAERIVTHGAKLGNVRLLDERGNEVKVARFGDVVHLVADVEFVEDAPQPVASCFVRNEQGLLVFDQTTLWCGITNPDFRQGARATLQCSLQVNLVDGVYSLGLDLHYRDLTCYYDRLESAATLVVCSGTGAKGVADLACRFSLAPSSAVNLERAEALLATQPREECDARESQLLDSGQDARGVTGLGK